MTDTPRRLAAEALGTSALLAAVVGSGIMGERLAVGNGALALLVNSLATGCALFVLILVLAPVSGAHLNPAVTAVAAWRRELSWREAAAYVAAQVAGAIAGVLVAHAMFELPVLQYSSKVRSGGGQWLAESVATFGLVFVIAGCRRRDAKITAPAVAAYITAAYWFTASTSFANPAVTLARSLSNTFTGVQPADVAAFVLAQLAGAAAAALVSPWVFDANPEPKP